jgi:hypothetical protein
LRERETVEGLKVARQCQKSQITTIEHIMTEPAIEQQEAELHQVLEQVKDLLGYGRLKAARELLERALQQYPTNERILLANPRH